MFALLQTWPRSGIMPCRALTTRLMSSTGALLRPASIALSTWRTTSTGLTMCAYARFRQESGKKTITAANGQSLVHVPPAGSCTRDNAGFFAGRPPLWPAWSGVPDLDGRPDPATFLERNC